MILSNVNIGSGPNAGNGDKLRTAFNTINNNFAKIQSNVNGLSNTNVTSVAGRTGNIVITTQDIVGINNYATINYVTSQLANVGAANVVSLQANVIALQADVNTLYGNAGVQSATLATLTANAAAQAGELTTLTANAAAQAGNLASLLSNAAVQAGGIADLLSNAGSQHEAITSLQSNVSTLFGNAAVQAGLIANLQLSATNYGNSNVATYLTTYGGNVSVSNIIFDDLSIQTTAYTGTQWRSNLESNVRVKPSWLSYVAGGKNQEGTQYGFDTGGMFFTDNADNDFAYPIQTSLNFHEQDVLEVVATIYYSATNNDHGLCIFPAGGSPIWRSTTDSTRIAFQYSAGIPVLYGQTTSNTAPGISVLTAGNYYTVKFKYDPGNTVVVETFSGNTATGTPIDSRSLGEILPAGDYKLGFDADNDAFGVKSYWTNLIVRTLTNTAVNDIEVQGQVTGNLIPSANVTYSLGNVAYQWKDLFVSNNTIYIGGIPLSIDGGGNLLINGNTVTSSYGNTQVATYLPTYTGNIGGNIVVNGSLRVTSSNASPFTSSDALYVTGGITSGADMSAGGNITACAFTISDSINSGAIKTNGGIAAWGNLNIGGYASIGGILKVEDGVHEKFQSLADATGVVTHNCAAGHIFYHTSPDANWTANFANLNLASGYATTLTLVISQGATGYYANAVQIGGAAQTINWQGNTTPTPSSNRTDVASFSIINNSGTYTVLGQLTGF